MRFTRPALVALLTLATGSEALAQADVVMAPRSRQPALLEAYTAYIGHDDLFNSSGVRLTRPAAILRQDRANVHAYGLRQRGDQGDAFFASQGNRAALEGMLSAGRMAPAAARAIVDGGAVVRVEVWGRGSVGDYIHVEVY
ncbi:hypothetical protein [Antarcticirhabdus aurantiaca]|uniref:Uncharacterized protein n=1 Tax=Antarcticirhabdus aurantiaca TaxID=2606717 RepID=A0ACD4NM60_9HYPH|nr:hypothetical protein [Antarcticirhabdus aurantiaca]WAJ27797.1 hypothetical protein OXU80_23620 [Jeongeuplla avenae]